MADTCGSLSDAQQDYDLSLHIGALFLILFVSGMACAFPLLVVKIPQLRVPSTFLFFVRHFGTGVLLATAFVHLLPTAFISLTDPCLPPFWNEWYPAMAGAIAMAGVFVIVVIEMVFSPGRSMCELPVTSNKTNLELVVGEDSKTKGRYFRAARVGQRTTEQPPPSTVSTDTATTLSWQRQEQDDSFDNHMSPQLTPSQRFKRENLQCVLLEMGILFHSIFIGMALSVAIGSDFVVLLIAIAFHQTFEGLALGSRIAAISFPSSSLQPWLMAFAYGCTTPIGQAIGLGMHSAYYPQSATGLILVGVMNSISSGLLTYASLVELMAEDFLSEKSWRTLRGNKRIGAFVLVGSGAVCMAVVGGWA